LCLLHRLFSLSSESSILFLFSGGGQTKAIGSTNGKGGPDEDESIKSNVTNDVYQTEVLSYSFQIIKNDTKNSHEIKSLPTDYDSVISATYGLPIIKNDNKKLNNNNAQTINKQPLIYSNQNNKSSDIQTLDISNSSSGESSYISNTLLDLLFDLDIQGNMASI
jgi:hypothetical protein